MSKILHGCLALAALTLVVPAGCGSEKVSEVDVSGKVTLDGEPIPQGSIKFVATDGVAPTGGGVIKDGAYTAKVAPGSKIVLVVGVKLVGQEPEYEGVPDSPMRDKFETLTPEVYNAKESSPLKADVAGPQQDLNFELTKSAK